MCYGARVHIFIDESGAFRPTPSATRPVAALGALVVPDGCLEELEYEYRLMRLPWLRHSPEPKGSQLDDGQIVDVLDLLNRYDVIFEPQLVDVTEIPAEVMAGFKEQQARDIEASIAQNQGRPIPGLADLANQIRKQPDQLFIQGFFLIYLVDLVFNTAPTYYAQRLPSELSSFTWVIDAKDTVPGNTPAERLWRELVTPAVCASNKKGLKFFPGLDYSGLDKFATGQPPVYDLGLILRDRIFFRDSKTCMGLQLVDIVTSALTKSLNGKLGRRAWGHLGRLIIDRGQDTLLVGALHGPRRAASRNYVEVMQAIYATTKDIHTPEYRARVDAQAAAGHRMFDEDPLARKGLVPG
jgi:hypothetical protein